MGGVNRRMKIVMGKTKEEEGASGGDGNLFLLAVVG